MSTRRRLPNRRPCETVEIVHDGAAYAVSLGFDEIGRVREVFAGSGAKAGSHMDGVLSDACVLMSLALQHGVEPAALPASLGRVIETGERVSVIGAVADLVASEL